MHRTRGKNLGLAELIAIALGGMIGGGIFTILGIAVSLVGVFTPIALLMGGLIAALAAYSYVKLGVYYRDEGATYAFFKLTFPRSSLAAALIGWWVSFGYISTLALYAYTFASYAMSGSEIAGNEWARKGVAIAMIITFALINIWSVRGMGKLEDLMVYTKLAILAVISFLLIRNGDASVPVMMIESDGFNLLNIMIVASVTFVAFEGFQLVIHAVGEMESPEKMIPRAIFSAIAIAILIYLVISLGALAAIPLDHIVRNQEYALASGAGEVLGSAGANVVVFGALLATSSAVSGTLFGASRLMAAIAKDRYFPSILAKRRGTIPVNAILAMSGLAICLLLAGNLRVILEFGSVTFLLVSFLMAVANFKIRKATHSSSLITVLALVTLAGGTGLILYFEAITQIEQLLFIGLLYAILTVGAVVYAAMFVKDNPDGQSEAR